MSVQQLPSHQANGQAKGPPPFSKSDREITLTRGYVTLVESKDYDRLTHHPSGKPKMWYADFRSGGIVYAARRGTKEDGSLRRKKIYMHREVMGLSGEDTLEVDHEFHDTLDNRYRVLSVVDHSANTLHTRRKPGKHGFFGVAFLQDCNRKKPWVARFQVDGKNHNLGYFETAIEAAHAYNMSAIQRWGHLPESFLKLRLNFPLDVRAEKALKVAQVKQPKERASAAEDIPQEIPF